MKTDLSVSPLWVYAVNSAVLKKDSAMFKSWRKKLRAIEKSRLEKCKEKSLVS